MSVWEGALPCPSCGGRLRLRSGRYGRFYGCENWPACDVVHGAHQATGEPLGVPADQATRRLRIAVHQELDVLWRGPAARMRRRDAYGWLAQALGLEERACHVGRFDREQCVQALAVLLFEGKVTPQW